MTEQVEDKEIELSDADALAAMQAGFDGSDTMPEPTVAEVVEEAPVETPDDPVDEPEVATVTESELREALAKQLEEFKAETKVKLDKAFGKFGAIQDSLTQIQQARQSVSFTPDKLAKLSSEFPELAALLAEDLTGILGEQQPAKEPKETQPAFDEASFKAQFMEEQARQLSEYERKLEIRALTRQHKDWKEIITFELKDDDAVQWSNAEFGKYVAKLPTEIQDEITRSNDADFLSEHISAFKEAQKQAADAKIATQKRLEKAVIPRGVPGVAAQKSALDEMREGFANAM